MPIGGHIQHRVRPGFPHRAGEDVGAAHELSDVAGRGPLINLGGGADLLEPAAMQQADAAGHRQRLVLVVGDKHEGGAGFALHAQQLLPGLFAQVAVERGHRLVEQQQAGPGRQRAGKGDALPLAAAERIRLAPGEAFESHELQQLRHARADAGLGRPLPAQAESDVVRHRHVREQGVGLERRVHGPAVRRQVRDVLPVERDAPGARLDEAAQRAQQRGLAAAGSAEQHEHLARADREVELLERHHRAVADDQVLDFEAGQSGQPALKRAHMRVRARSAAWGGALTVKNDAIAGSDGNTLRSFLMDGSTLARLPGTALA